MSLTCRQRFDQQAGFSLVEIMVGMAIGLLATLVIMQVFSFFEGQKRATTGGADAQSNGTVALYTVTKDLQMAGFGLLPAADSPLECDPVPTIDHDLNAATAVIDISPVIITDGGNAAGASDIIAIRSGNSQMAGIPSVISAMVGMVATVDNNLGCAVGDVALLVSGATCNLTRVTALSTPPVYTNITLQSATGAVPGANLSCLGGWQQTVYDVSSGNLRLNGVPMVAGIVNLQAQYGISAAANSNRVVQWVDATNDVTSGINWAAPSVGNRNRIKAVRVAIVARSGTIEKEDVSTACSSTAAAGPTGVCAWDATSALPSPIVSPYIASPAPAVDLSNDPDWQRYRYRVFETIMPLRNVLWSKDAL